jgi:hypothetical protein
VGHTVQLVQSARVACALFNVRSTMMVSAAAMGCLPHKSVGQPVADGPLLSEESSPPKEFEAASGRHLTVAHVVPAGARTYACMCVGTHVDFTHARAHARKGFDAGPADTYLLMCWGHKARLHCCALCGCTVASLTAGATGGLVRLSQLHGCTLCQ